MPEAVLFGRLMGGSSMSPTVLIAEDSDSTRLALKTALKFHKFDVVGEAIDGEQAVTMFKELGPDIILMDIAMPKKHGIDAIRELKVIDPQAKIVVITALYSPEKRKEAIDVGASALVEKPFNIPDLINTMEKVLSG